MERRIYITGKELGYRVSEIADDHTEAGHLLDGILEKLNASKDSKKQKNDDFLYNIETMRSVISDQHDQLEHPGEGKYGVATFAIDGRGVSAAYRAIYEALYQLEKTDEECPTPALIWEHLPEVAQREHLYLFKLIIGGPIDDTTIRHPHEWGSKLRAWIGNHSSECKYDPNDPLLQEKFAIAHTFWLAMCSAVGSYTKPETKKGEAK